MLNRVTQEFYQNEINAIERSTLNEKEKTATTIRLMEEKNAKEKETAAEVKRIRREQAEFDKRASMAQILISTALAEIKVFTGAGTYYEKLAQYIATGVIGASALALAASADIPAYEHGTGDKPHKGGLARFGEKGKPEIIKEPNKSPYIVSRETVSYLPPGTEVIPLITDHPVFSGNTVDTSWDQTRYLAKQISKINKGESSITNNITIDLGFETHKAKKIYGLK